MEVEINISKFEGGRKRKMCYKVKTTAEGRSVVKLRVSGSYKLVHHIP